MEKLGKEIIGILVLKLSVNDVLNLRFACKKLNSIILSYNKYWFLKCFGINTYHIMFKFLKGHYHEYTQSDGKKISLPDLNCTTNKSVNEVDAESEKHEKYSRWKMQGIELGLVNENKGDFLNAYIRYRFLKCIYNDELFYPCQYSDHDNESERRVIYVALERPMRQIFFLEDSFIPFYIFNKNYFKKLIKYKCRKYYNEQLLIEFKKEIDTSYFDIEFKDNINRLESSFFDMEEKLKLDMEQLQSKMEKLSRLKGEYTINIF